ARGGEEDLVLGDRGDADQRAPEPEHDHEPGGQDRSSHRPAGGGPTSLGHGSPSRYAHSVDGSSEGCTYFAIKPTSRALGRRRGHRPRAQPPPRVRGAAVESRGVAVGSRGAAGRTPVPGGPQRAPPVTAARCYPSTG